MALICWPSFQPLQSEAGTIVVTTLANGGAGSLRASIANANPGDLITFAVTGTITNLTGEIQISQDVSIIGPDPNTLTVSGNHSGRVFNIAAGTTVNISGLTICNGHAADGAAGTNSTTPGWPGGDGGGIYNLGTLALTNCVVTSCRSGQGGPGYSDSLFLPPGGSGASGGGSGGNGAGIYNGGTLTLDTCTVSSNTNGNGGSGGDEKLGIYNGGSAGNGGNGGGIYDLGSATLIACTLGFNSAGSGGAGGYGGRGDVGQPQGGAGGWGGNAGNGGGFNSLGSPTIISCTIANNSAGSGGQGGMGGAGYGGGLQSRAVGNGGAAGDGGAGGSGGGLYCPTLFNSVACTFTANVAGTGGNGGKGGAGGAGLSYPGGNGGNGGNGGDAGTGGGVNSSGGWASLQNVLVAQNSAGTAGAAGTGGAGGIGTPHGTSGSPGYSGLSGSGADLLGVFTSNGRNLIGLDDGNSGFTDGVRGDIVGSATSIDARTSPLANHGGPTWTCALLAGSPALETGDDTLLDSPLNLTTDQRGFPRESGPHVDIGAFEVQWAVGPLRFLSCTRTTNGAIQMMLTNVPGASLTALAATNISLPTSSWIVLGPLQEVSAGQFQFLDADTGLQRFYRVRCP